MLYNTNKPPFLRQLEVGEVAGGTTQTDVYAPRWLTAPFRPISLEQLNAKADMLQRLDNKYVIRAADLERAMVALGAHFDILEIGGQRDFTYETCYFDDPARTNYFDQHRGRRKRSKVRMRKYVEANLCFVEIKLKAKRSITIKQRMACDPGQYGALNHEAQEFIRTAHREQYGENYDLALEPVLEMRYRRVTLVAKQGGERMTVDFGLQFAGSATTRDVDAGVFLIETKSANANGVADKILRGLHQHPTSGCSKYCVAMAALQQVSKYNKFLVAMRRLDVMPAAALGARGTMTARNVAPSRSARVGSQRGYDAARAVAC